MKLSNLFFIIAILTITSCNTVKNGKSSSPVDDDKTIFHSKFVLKDTNHVALFVSEEFVPDALNNYTIAKINKNFLSLLNCSKEPITNKYNTSIIDTIYTFSNSKNKIQFYRSKQKDFIVTFDVTDEKFNLTGNIKPGMTKDIFSRKFQITEAINNKVQVSNSEGTMRFMFYFENNSLKRINTYLYLD